MNLVYEYQTSRSFMDLRPRSLRFTTFSNFFPLETARSIEAKFHMEPPWDLGMKDYSAKITPREKTRKKTKRRHAKRRKDATRKDEKTPREKTK